MLFIRALTTLLVIIVLSGCGSRQYIEREYLMTPHSDIWPDGHRQVALKSYRYAQMANNTYGQAGDEYRNDEKEFLLPDNYQVSHFGNDEVGLAHSVYRKYSGEKLEEVVLVFRGTEGGTDTDDLAANILARQNPKAIEYYQKLKDRLIESGHSEVPITLVGHSLGGALAIHTAINVDDNRGYYVFNTSPRFYKIDKQYLGAERHSIVEVGEFLRLGRAAAKEADQLYTPYNCNPSFAPASDHSIENLAVCLTNIAALNDPEAKVIMVERGTANREVNSGMWLSHSKE
ncbi:MAG: hypothetical protein C9356_11720 [Oleiphilus sp.]|nr:MAG: hypothetical protein C9356_11720 [Oleiphilus sp.]